MNEIYIQMWFGLALIVCLFGGYEMLVGRIVAGFSILLLGILALAIIVYVNLSHGVQWDKDGITLSQPFRKKHRFGWHQIARITHGYGGVKALPGVSRRLCVQFFDNQRFEFEPRTKNPSSIAFMIALGRHLEDDESTELAKPLLPGMLSNETIEVFEKSTRSMGGLALLSLGAVISVLILIGVYVYRLDPLVHISVCFLILYRVTPAYLDMRKYLKTLRAWRDNPAFTDPDKPVESLMYDQYGDLAEPLGRFYRHVWANDAKRLHQLAKTNQNHPKLP